MVKRNCFLLTSLLKFSSIFSVSASAKGFFRVCKNSAAFLLRSACSCFSFDSLEACASFSLAAAANLSSSFCFAKKRNKAQSLEWVGLGELGFQTNTHSNTNAHTLQPLSILSNTSIPRHNKDTSAWNYAFPSILIHRDIICLMKSSTGEVNDMKIQSQKFRLLVLFHLQKLSQEVTL